MSRDLNDTVSEDDVPARPAIRERARSSLRQSSEPRRPSSMADNPGRQGVRASLPSAQRMGLTSARRSSRDDFDLPTLSRDVTSRYWLPGIEDWGWAPCIRKEIDATGAEATFQEPRSGEDILYTHKIFKKWAKDNGWQGAKDIDSLHNLQKVVPSQLTGEKNLFHVEDVSEAVVLHTLRTRYERDQIYTQVARIVIVVNPFKHLEKDSTFADKSRYLDGDSLDLPPHIFGIGLDALNCVRKNSRQSQAVLISGESGAGKTESAKIVMAYIAEVGKSGGAEGGKQIEEQVMETNPILESFGNAMTERNNNSSRFGKWVEIYLSRQQAIQGCGLVDYVLEMSRVCNPGPMERNYHVFFQVLGARDSDLLDGLGAGAPSDYRYLRDCQSTAPGIDDGKDFKQLTKALDGFGINKSEIFKVILGILTLGNLDFLAQSGSGHEEAVPSNPQEVDRAANLLGVNRSDLLKAIMVQKIVEEEKTRTVTGAEVARDALARLMYGRLFKWLIAQMNRKLQQTSTHRTTMPGRQGHATGTFFGILDIAGFEIFETNSLEQLLINLTNEILHQHFNKTFFAQELAEYKKEGLKHSFQVDYVDNTEVVLLINQAKPPGILSLLDEAQKLGNDVYAFMNSVKSKYEKNRALKVSKATIKPGAKDVLDFTIKHYAGDVQYASEEFLEKNADKPPEDASELMKSSSLAVLQELGAAIEEEMTDQGTAVKRIGQAAKKTLSSGFRSSLTDLQDKLSQAEPHFIRCMKPNNEKVPDKFVGDVVLEQIRYCGVVEAVKMRQSGFSSREPFQDFMERYRLVVPIRVQESCFGKDGSAKSPRGGFKDRVTEFIAALPASCKDFGEIPEGSVLVGATKVFAKMQASIVLNRANECAKAKEERKKAARLGLEDAIQRRMETSSVNLLQAALKEGKDADLEDCELEAAQRVLAEETRKQAYREELKDIVQRRKIVDLQKGISHGQTLGLSSDDLADATKVLLEEERKVIARQGLEAARFLPEIEGLRAAIEECKAAGIAPEEFVSEQTALEHRERLAKEVEYRDVERIRRAIANAEAKGLPEIDLAAARKALSQEERKLQLNKELKEAEQTRDLDALRRLVAEAETIGMSTATLEAAKKAALEEERKLKAKQSLEAACQSCDIEKLNAAILECEVANVAKSELTEACDILNKEQRKVEVRTNLREATEHAKMAPLRKAVKDAHALGLTGVDVEAAEKALAIEERKAEARKQLIAAQNLNEVKALREAITHAQECGLAGKDVESTQVVLKKEERKIDARKELKAAAQSHNKEKLRSAIQESEDCGLEEWEYEEHKDLLDKELRKEEARCNLRDAVEHRGMKELSAAIKKGESLLLRADELADAKRVLAEEKRKELARRGLGTALKSREITALRDAIEEGVASGLDAAELEPAQKALQEEEKQARKEAALSGLRGAVQGRNVDEPSLRLETVEQLRAATAEAKDAEVAFEHIRNAEVVLREEEQKIKAKEHLQDVLGRRSLEPEYVDSLRNALDTAKLSGLVESEMEAAQALLAEEERKQKALKTLEHAVASRSIQYMREAINEGEAAGIDAPHLALAKATLAEEDEKAAASLELVDAAASRNIQRLKSAIGNATTLGVASHDLDQAKQALTEEEQKKEAQSKLDEAVRSLDSDLETLRSVIQNAQAVGLRDPSLDQAREKLAREEGKAEALKRIETAERDRDVDALRSAISQAEAVEVEAHKLRTAKGILEEEDRRILARAALTDAQCSKDLVLLRKALATGRAVGLEAAELEGAKQALSTEERKFDARGALQIAIKLASHATTTTRDVESLSAAIDEGVAAGLDASDLEPARQALTREKEKERARTKLDEATRARSIELLQAAITAGQSAGLPESAFGAASKALAEEKRKIAAGTSLKAAMARPRVDDLQAALAEAEASGLGASELDAGRKALAEEERKVLARSALERAVNVRSFEELEAAIKEGEAACLEDRDLASARACVKEQKNNTVAFVRKAVADRELGALRLAIKEGERIGLPALELDPARRALDGEERRLLAKNALEAAVRSREVGAMRAAIAEAEAAGLTKAELATAKRIVGEVDRLGAAQRGLQTALTGQNLCILRAAIEEGQAAGVVEEDLVSAKSILVKRENRAAAHIDLEEAKFSRDLALLRTAIRSAYDAGLDDSEIEAGKRILAEEEEKEAAVAALRNAERRRDLEALRTAIAAGHTAGLPFAEFRQAEIILAEEQKKEAARTGLAEAVENRRVDKNCILTIRAAIREGHASGLDAAELIAARAALAEEERLSTARKRLNEALASRHLDDLQEAIIAAEKAGMTASSLANAKASLEEEAAIAAVIARLVEATEKSDVHSLRAAIADGESLGIEAHELATAKEALVREKRKLDVRYELDDAVQSHDVDALRTALALGKELGLEASCLRAAKEVLDMEAHKAEVRSFVEDAESSTELAVLRDAVAQGEAARLEARELRGVRRLLAEAERKDAARSALQRAIGSGSSDVIYKAIAEGKAAGLPEPDFEAAKHELEEEERRDAARVLLQAAVACRDMEALSEALAEGEAAGLQAMDLEVAKRTWAEEQRKCQARLLSKSAMQSRSVAELQQAIVEGKATGLDTKELDKALNEEKRKAAAVATLEEAEASKDMDTLRAALSGAEAVGLTGNPLLATIKEIIAKEERKAAARSGLRQGLRSCAVEELRAAIAEAEAAGLEEKEMRSAKRTFEEEEAKLAARIRLEASLENGARDPETLRQALQEAQKAGLSDAELKDAKRRLKDWYQAKARADLKRAMEAGPDTEAVMSALLEAAAADLPTKELEAGHAAVATAAGRRFLDVRDGLLPPVAELAMEIECRTLQVEGIGGLDVKMRDPTAFGDANEGGMAFASFVETTWFAKEGNVLDELSSNLRAWAESNDPNNSAISPTGGRPLGRQQLTRLVYELQSRAAYGGAPGGQDEKVNSMQGALAAGIGPLAHFPVLLASMLLWTQHDVDIDRLMLFPDCPSMARSRNASPAERRLAFQPYREKVKQSRNPTIFREASAAFRSSWIAHNIGRPNEKAEATLRKWVKTMCLLSAARQRFDTPKTVTRCFLELPEEVLEELKRKNAGDRFVWAALTSATCNPGITQRYVEGTVTPVERNAVVKISGLTEGLELFHVSQYPHEQEILLPLFSQLVVKEVIHKPSQPLMMHCEFEKSAMPTELEKACRLDLLESSFELVRDLLGEPTPLPTPRLSRISPLVAASPFSPKEARRPISMGRLRSEKTAAFTALGSRARRRAPSASASLYTIDFFRSLFSTFEIMDRRGVCAVSREDFLWAKAKFSRSADFQRLSQNDALLAYFYNKDVDLGLYRFLTLASPGASQADLANMARWAIIMLRGEDTSQVRCADNNDCFAVGMRKVALR